MIDWGNGWLWIVAAGILALIELMFPGWAFISLAAATGLMGLAILSHVWTADPPLTLFVTALLSGGIWGGLWLLFPRQRGSVRVWDRDINDN